MITDYLKDDFDMEREHRALAVRNNVLMRRLAQCSSNVKLILFKVPQINHDSGKVPLAGAWFRFPTLQTQAHAST